MSSLRPQPDPATAGHNLTAGATGPPGVWRWWRARPARWRGPPDSAAGDFQSCCCALRDREIKPGGIFPPNGRFFFGGGVIPFTYDLFLRSTPQTFLKYGCP